MEIRHDPLRCVAFATALVLLWVCVTPAQVRDGQANASPGGIRGRIVAGATGEGIGGATVHLSADGAAIEPRSVVTDASGHYAFDDLPAGRYFLHTAHRPYIPTAYGTPNRLGRGTPIDVEPNRVVEGIDLRLTRGGVITGTVFTPFGQPAVGARVVALAARGTRDPAFSHGDQTDDLGRFRLFGLPTGRYLVRVESMVSGVSDQRRGQAATYFPGTANPAEAAPVPVETDKETPGVDVRIVETDVYTISGRVVSSSGALPRDVMVVLRPEGDTVLASVRPGRLEADGGFRITRVVPGRYRLFVRPLDRATEKAEFGEASVAVGDADVSGVTITTSPGVTLQGQVFVESIGDVEPPSPSAITVFAGADSTGFELGTSRASVRDDWTFTLENVWGTHTMMVSIRGDTSWGTKTIRLNGRDVIDRTVDFGRVSGRESLELWLTSALPRLEGIVVDSRGNPVSDCDVLVFTADQEFWDIRPTRRIRATRPDADGRFTTRAVPPGRYHVVARDVIEGWQRTDPTFLRAAARRAVSIELVEGQRAQVQLELTPVR